MNVIPSGSSVSNALREGAKAEHLFLSEDVVYPSQQPLLGTKAYFLCCRTSTWKILWPDTQPIELFFITSMLFFFILPEHNGVGSLK